MEVVFLADFIYIIVQRGKGGKDHTLLAFCMPPPPTFSFAKFNDKEFYQFHIPQKRDIVFKAPFFACFQAFESLT